MATLADTTELLDKTTNVLMDSDESRTAEAGIELINKWIPTLSESENTQPIAAELGKLKDLLENNAGGSAAIVGQMGVIAAKVLLIAPDIGAEGEMPSLLTALATALRMGADDVDKE